MKRTNNTNEAGAPEMDVETTAAPENEVVEPKKPTRRELKKKLKAEYKAAKKEYKAKKRALKRATRFRRLAFTAAMLCLIAMLPMAFADTIPEAEVNEYREQIQAEDVAVLPEGAVLDDDEPVVWTPVPDAWAEGDNERIIAIGCLADGFDSIAAGYEGEEIAKIQECIVVAVDTDGNIECEAPDGNIYVVSNDFGVNLGDTVAISFLLRVDA